VHLQTHKTESGKLSRILYESDTGFRSLVENALNAMPNGGKLTITSKESKAIWKHHLSTMELECRKNHHSLSTIFSQLKQEE